MGHIPSHSDFEEEVRLVSKKWMVEDKAIFNQDEIVLQCKVLYLTKSSKMTQKHPLVCISTGSIQGEDQQSKGRVLVYNVIPAKHNKNKLHLLAQLDKKGPISAISEIQGKIAVGILSKVYFFQLEESEGELLGKAFFETKTFISTLSSINNYLLVGDAYSSIQLLIWRNEIRQLVLLSKDTERNCITASGFIVHGSKLSLVVADESRNVRVYSYEPSQAYDATGNEVLVPRSNIHIGGMIPSLFPVNLHFFVPKYLSYLEENNILTPKNKQNFDFSSVDPSHYQEFEKQSKKLSLMFGIIIFFVSLLLALFTKKQHNRYKRWFYFYSSSYGRK